MFKKFSVLLSLVLVMGLALVGCGGAEDTIGSGSSEEKKQDLKIVGEIEETMVYGTPIYRGVVQNNTDEVLDYVEITFNLYDKEGTQIGTAYTNTTDLKAKGKWKFEAYGDSSEDEKPDHYEYTISTSAY